MGGSGSVVCQGMGAWVVGGTAGFLEDLREEGSRENKQASNAPKAGQHVSVGWTLTKGQKDELGVFGGCIPRSIHPREMVAWVALGTGKWSCLWSVEGVF